MPRIEQYTIALLGIFATILMLGGCRSEGSTGASGRKTDIVIMGGASQAAAKVAKEKSDIATTRPVASPTARSTRTKDRNLTGPTVLVTGRITLTDGRPATNASIRLASYQNTVAGQIQWNALDQAITDKNGRYEAYGKDGSLLRLNLSGDFPSTSIDLDSMPSNNRGLDVLRKIRKDIVIPEGHAVTGRVIDEAGKPLPGVPVHLRADKRLAEQSREANLDVRSSEELKTTTTENGEFVFNHAASGPTFIGTIAPGYAPIAQSVDLPTTTPIILQLAAHGGTIQGYVYRKSDSSAVADTSITLATESPHRLKDLERQSLFSGADGSFRFDNVASGTLRLFASKTHGTETELIMAPPFIGKFDIADNQTTDVVIFMYGGVSVAGLVYDKDTSDPLSGVTVEVSGHGNTKSATTDAAGRYRVDHVFASIPQVLYVHANHESYMMETTKRRSGDREFAENVSVEEDYPTPIVQDLPMVPVVKIRGKVVTRDEVPVPNVSLRFLTSNDYYNSSQIKPIPAKGDGTFELKAKPFTKGVIAGKAAGFAEGKSNIIEVLTEDINDVKIVMDVGAVVQGVVIDENQKPVDQANVYNIVNYSEGSISFGNIEAVGTSGADEQFILRDLSSKVQLNATKAGFAGSEREIIDLTPGETRTGVQLQLRTGHNISGRVIWSDKSPVTDIYINASSASNNSGSAQTDKDGIFKLENLAEGTYTLLAYHNNIMKQVPNIKTGTTDIEIILEGTGGSPVTLIGTVVDAESGEIIKDIVLPKRPGLEKLPEPGKFQWRNLVSTGYNSVEITSEGYDKKSFRINTEGKSGTIEETFRLGKQGAITGRTIEAGTGKPVANVIIINYSDIPSNDLRRKPITHTTTDSEGRFVLAPAPYGKNYINVKPAAPNIELQKTADVKSEDTTDVGDIELSAGGTITGRVVTGTDTSAPDKEVIVDGYLNEQRFNKKTKTNSDGKFEINGVPAFNNFNVKCGAVTKVARVTGTETVDVQIRLGGVTMSGMVTKAGQPARASITAKGPEGQSLSTFSREEGYKLEGILPGHYDFQVGTLRESIVVPDEPEFKKDFDLPSGQLKVIVTDAMGEPVNGAQVAANIKESPGGIERSWEIRSKTATTESDGVAEFADLAHGTYTVTAAKIDMGSDMNPAVNISDQPADVKLQLKGGGGTLVSVALKASDGSPQPQAWCYLYGSNGLFTHAAQRDASGVMTIKNIPPGKYRTNVSTWGHSQSEREVEIKEGQTETIEDVLYGAGSIQWVLKKADGSPAAGASVTVTPLQTDPVDHARTGMTDSFGNFEDRGMAPGNYQVTAQLSGKQSVTEVFEVKVASHTAKDKTVPGW